VKVESKSLTVQIFTTLKSRIMKWEYPPGYRLTEEAISDEFEVSRSPVREALRMLAENDYVDKMPHRSYTVRQTDLDRIKELYNVREALELYVVELLTKVDLDPGYFDDLYQTWHSLLNELPLIDTEMADRDEEFHEALAEATDNRTLLEMLHTINERLRFVRLTDFITVERQHETCQQHIDILDSIIAKNTSNAREAMQQNIETGCQNVETAVKEALIKAYMKQTYP
jgi:DNA-binding GntR family transcriptional regulator